MSLLIEEAAQRIANALEQLTGPLIATTESGARRVVGPSMLSRLVQGIEALAPLLAQEHAAVTGPLEPQQQAVARLAQQVREDAEREVGVFFSGAYESVAYRRISRPELRELLAEFALRTLAAASRAQAPARS